MRVGFAGLGRMGVRMAENLVAAGHDVTVWNRSAEKAEGFAAAHRTDMARTPKTLADAVDVVVTMLADDASSQVVHLGPEGLFAGRRAQVFVEMGTLGPDHLRALAAATDKRVIDAPVSGATQAATEAQLLIMAGCDAATLAELQPLFDAMGKKTICLGKPGAGAVMKLAVNMLIHGLNQTLAEAMTLAEAAGIAPDAAFDVIEASAAAAPMLTYRRPLYLDEAGHDVTFTVALAEKDLRVAGDLARGLGVALPQSQVTQAILEQAIEQGFAARDMAAILSYMREQRQ
ncbi:NAD(P)-dependent oxidoreductase [Alterinioella nitratireducens]|uniref:NAD(P)-dependent oxidoreductase n=1 Tax=Alterinioella nitratireducens TaxID=2735915 RepID=UPI001557432B|nr:NAD(P)-dependent oxidoreductase [Alterinioella nitratireducens]NPD17828.1 NAD(P)-dependent oxidoreductase [Alterinioella nitratireducens]